MSALHYALVVGVDRYPGRGAEDQLTSPVADAGRFRDWLEDKDGGALDPANIRYIGVDRGQVGVKRYGARPNKGDLHNALFELAKRCKARIEKKPADWYGTRLYVYVSGHGLAPRAGEAALLMADSSPEWPGENFPCARFMRYYEEVQTFHELVFFADCCRSREDDAVLADPPWKEPPGNNGTVHRMTAFAAKFGDPAYEPPPEDANERLSYFTKALIEGLRDHRAADAKKTRIDSESLKKWLLGRVRELTVVNEHTGKKRKFPQEPDILAPDEIVFKTLTSVETGASKEPLKLAIRFATAFKGDVYLLSGTLQPIGRHTVSAAVWETTVPKAGLYRVHPAAGDAPAASGAANPFKNGGHFTVGQEENSVEL